MRSEPSIKKDSPENKTSMPLTYFANEPLQIAVVKQQVKQNPPTPPESVCLGDMVPRRHGVCRWWALEDSPTLQKVFSRYVGSWPRVAAAD